MADDKINQPEYTLSLERVLKAPVAKVWRCWTEPALLEKWFCPRPWYVTDAVIDLRPGGEFSMTMNGPDGQSFPNSGVFLLIEPCKKIITTDAFRPGWIPSERAFMTAEMTFEDLADGRSRYSARAMHWDKAAREEHENMGFHEGWGKATDQLEALAGTL